MSRVQFKKEQVALHEPVVGRASSLPCYRAGSSRAVRIFGARLCAEHRSQHLGSAGVVTPSQVRPQSPALRLVLWTQPRSTSVAASPCSYHVRDRDPKCGRRHCRKESGLNWRRGFWTHRRPVSETSVLRAFSGENHHGYTRFSHEIWPKRSSGVPSDLEQTAVRAFGLGAGLADYKICAVDATWSGLLFTRRGPRRP